MPIYPDIALGVRPPQIPQAEIQTPIDRFGRLLTLRGLMESQELRQLQIEEQRRQMAQAREQAERETQFRGYVGGLPAGETVAPGKAYSLLGPGPGGQFLQSQASLAATEAQRELTRNNLAIQQLQLIRNAALNSTDAATRNRNLMDLVNNKIVPQAMAQQILDSPYDAKATQDFATSLMDPLQRLQVRNQQLTYEHNLKIYPQQETISGLNLTQAQKAADASNLFAAMTQGPAVFATELAKLPAERQKLFLGAKTAHEVLERARTPAEVFTQEYRLTPNTIDELIIWRNSPGRTAEEISNADAMIKQMTQYRISTRPVIGVGDAAAWIPRVASGEVKITDVPQKIRGAVLEGLGETKIPEDKPATQAQHLVAGYAARMVQSENTLSKVLEGKVEQTWNRLPIFEWLRTDKGKEFQQAERNWINANLRRESGAVISDEEFRNARLQYIPQPGDSPARLEQKRQNRLVVQQNFIRASGSAYANPEQLLREAGALPPATGAPGGGKIAVPLKSGQTAYFDTQAQANKFKTDHPDRVK